MKPKTCPFEESWFREYNAFKINWAQRVQIRLRDYNVFQNKDTKGITKIEKQCKKKTNEKTTNNL